ncbi:MAG: hypothetical protein IH988_02215 [Planctomycetes bacterium]|nr:hypothetical protein [Planctomycetota bacterium]
MPTRVIEPLPMPRWLERTLLLVIDFLAINAATVVLLLVLAAVAGLGWVYLSGVALVAVLLLVENSLVHPGDYSRVNIAFFTVNGLVSIGLGVLAVADILLAMPAVW